jgi:hypothetical protein
MDNPCITCPYHELRINAGNNNFDLSSQCYATISCTHSGNYRLISNDIITKIVNTTAPEWCPLFKTG